MYAYCQCKAENRTVWWQLMKTDNMHLCILNYSEASLPSFFLSSSFLLRSTIWTIRNFRVIGGGLAKILMIKYFYIYISFWNQGLYKSRFDSHAALLYVYSELFLPHSGTDSHAVFGAFLVIHFWLVLLNSLNCLLSNVVISITPVYLPVFFFSLSFNHMSFLRTHFMTIRWAILKFTDYSVRFSIWRQSWLTSRETRITNQWKRKAIFVGSRACRNDVHAEI